jgi:protein involved in polysaccharide export with SLBB domain
MPIHLLLIFSIGLLTACSGGTVVDSPKEMSDLKGPTGQVKAALPAEYRIQPEDQLDIKFFFNSELNEEKILVRPDGRISLQLVGDVMAAGRTPAELSATLRKLYDAELKRPEVAVILRSVAQHWVYVDGEVEKPAEVELRGRLSALQAIASVGGLKESGQLEEVLVMRRGQDGRPIVFSINLKEVLDGEDAKNQDVTLAPYDIVYVPRSTIGDVNRFVHLYIRKNIPITFGLFWNPLL